MVGGCQVDKSVIDELEVIVGSDYISTREDVLLTYSASASTGYERVFPSAVVRPANAAEVASILRVANTYQIPVTPRSGGSSLQAEVIPKPQGLVIDLLRLNEIHLFEDLRSIRVGAGVTFGELDKYLGDRGLWIPVFLLAVSFSVVKIGFIQADWVCSECGYIDRDALNKRRRVLKAVSLAWLLFYGFGLLDWMLQTPS